MALYMDKYRPSEMSQLTFHGALTSRLKALAQSSDFPHLLVYGPSGAGKKTRVACALKELFGSSTGRIRIDSRVFVTTSNRKLEFSIISSNHHIEISPSDVGMYDRVIVQDLIKEVAQTQQVDTTARHRFKAIVINEADTLTRDAQAALRRTMEKYSANIRIILVATSTSRIVAPIRSRCLLLRVPAPSETDISSALDDVVQREKLKLVPELNLRLARQSGRNMRRALLMLEALYAQNEHIDSTTPTAQPDWELVIGRVAVDILNDRTPAMILSVRDKFYELLVHCIPPTQILKLLMFKLFPLTDHPIRPQLVKWAAFYEHRLHRGRKAIFHLEAFVARIMRVVESHNMDVAF